MAEGSLQRVSAQFRFHGDLNGFLAPDRRDVEFAHAFDGTPSVKDRIESLGVPHTEIHLVLVDGELVGDTHRLEGGESVAVYPRLPRRRAAAQDTRFVLDVHLGRLAAFMRLLGFDSVYRNDLDDAEIVEIASADQRVVLTRDVGLLKNGRVTRGAFVHEIDPIRQLSEVVERFDLSTRTKPFTRCTCCNGPIDAMSAEHARSRVPEGVADTFHRFNHCPSCDQVFWAGSHCDRLRERFASVGIAL